MILEIILIILGILVVILGYTTFNLLRKLERLEDANLSQEEFILKFKEIVDFADAEIEKLDQKEVFKSDDEIGWFFSRIKEIQSMLSSFTQL